MTDDHDADVPMNEHPEDLLAPFVDGETTPEERAATRTHLATCSVCREEVELARHARAALAGLPELPSPWEPDAESAEVGHPLAANRGERGVSEPIRLADRRARRARVATGVGLAAAAAVVAVFVLNSGGGGSNSTSVRANATPAASPARGAAAPRVETRDSIAQLARSLAAGSALAVSPGDSAGGVESRPSIAAAPFDPACGRRAGALPSSAEQVVSRQIVFDGRPALVYGYRIPPSGPIPGTVEVVVVSGTGCRPLYLARAPTRAVPPTP